MNNLIEYKLFEGLYPDIFGATVYITKFATDKDYMVRYTRSYYGTNKIGDKFPEFLSKHGIKYSKNGSYLVMDETNAKRLKDSLQKMKA